MKEETRYNCVVTVATSFAGDSDIRQYITGGCLCVYPVNQISSILLESER